MRMRGLSHNSGTENRYWYNGKEYHQELGLGLYDYGFRWYDPAVARFVSVDPLAEEFKHYTTYQYAGNMPIWAIDLDGLEPASPGHNIGEVRVAPIQGAAEASQNLHYWQWSQRPAPAATGSGKWVQSTRPVEIGPRERFDNTTIPSPIRPENSENYRIENVSSDIVDNPRIAPTDIGNVAGGTYGETRTRLVTDPETGNRSLVPKLHDGTDIAAEPGETVRSARYGEVTEIRISFENNEYAAGSYGNFVTVTTTENGQTITLIYNHLNGVSVQVGGRSISRFDYRSSG